MARELANLPREGYSAYEHISGSHVRRGNGHNAIYAMHWDGTYRDRIWANSRLFWSEDPYIGDTDYSEEIISAATVAKHLAPETFNSDNAESVAGWII